jgi:hypothetical protein
VIDNTEMDSMLKIHISDWNERVPEGSITKNGNEKKIVKKIIETQAKLIAGSLSSLFRTSFRLNILDIFLF